MPVWGTSSEKFIISGNAGGKRKDRCCNEPFYPRIIYGWQQVEKNGCFNSEAMQVLKGREVTLIPDLGATEQWKKSALLSGICKRVVVSNVLECTSDEEQRSQGLDIADFFLYSPSKRQILHQMIQRNPALQLLIDELDLELIE